MHVYSAHAVEDGVTQYLRTYVSHWDNIAFLSDGQLAQKISDDGIDILIDLSGHTGKNRLLSFARKPAPIQASWMGYPGTTGLRAMDYYFADRYLAPPELCEDRFTEKLIYLPSNAPFQPFPAAPSVNDLPALEKGFITFGSFNRASKLTVETVALWSALLRALPSARLTLGGMSLDGGYDQLIDAFVGEGVASERLCFYPRTTMGEYLELHHQVDICLDTFPYVGGTTTCHALWMGVPTLTVAGLTPACRAGASILANLGLDTFVARDRADFVQKGIACANDLANLAVLRANLRLRCAESPALQPVTIASAFERALRIVWQRWCKGLSTISLDVSLPDKSQKITP